MPLLGPDAPSRGLLGIIDGRLPGGPATEVRRATRDVPDRRGDRRAVEASRGLEIRHSISRWAAAAPRYGGVAMRLKLYVVHGSHPCAAVEKAFALKGL